MRTTVFLLCCTTSFISAQTKDQAITLKNDQLSFQVLTPDAKSGYYRGSRFDWHGIVQNVDFAGHKLFQFWKSKQDPTNNDDVGGTAEEFGMTTIPHGFADAKPGEGFLKIGIGVLKKPDDKEYQFHRNYTIADPGQSSVSIAANTILTTHTITTKFGYVYELTKTITIDPKKPTFTIQRELKNTGKKPIYTDHYVHNFFNIDNQPIGPDYEISFAEAPKPLGKKDQWNDLGKLTGKSLQFTKPFDKGSIYVELAGHSDQPSSGTVTIQHKKTGVGVKITSDIPMKEWHVWGIATTICPEPFCEIKLDPGQTKKWSSTYEFYQEPRK